MDKRKPILEPLPSNFTIPTAKKARTSNFSKEYIQERVIAGRQILQEEKAMTAPEETAHKPTKITKRKGSQSKPQLSTQKQERTENVQNPEPTRKRKRSRSNRSSSSDPNIENCESHEGAKTKVKQAPSSYSTAKRPKISSSNVKVGNAQHSAALSTPAPRKTSESVKVGNGAQDDRMKQGGELQPKPQKRPETDSKPLKVQDQDQVGAEMDAEIALIEDEARQILEMAEEYATIIQSPDTSPVNCTYFDGGYSPSSSQQLPPMVDFKSKATQILTWAEQSYLDFEDLLEKFCQPPLQSTDNPTGSESPTIAHQAYTNLQSLSMKCRQEFQKPEESKFRTLQEQYSGLLEKVEKPPRMLMKLKASVDRREKAGVLHEIPPLKKEIEELTKLVESRDFQNRKKRLALMREHLNAL